jgi:hypothetical protein
VVGVVNRDQRGQGSQPVDLEAANQYETEWMERNVPELEVGRQVGIDALLILLDKLFHEHITSEWIPDALRKIDATLDRLDADIANLGPAPESYGGDLTPLLKQVADAVTRFLQPVGSSSGPSKVEVECRDFLAQFPSPPGPLTKFSVLNLDHVRARRLDKADTRRTANILLINIKSAVVEYVDRVLRDEEPSVANTERLRRFPRFHEAVLDVVLHKTEALYKDAWTEVDLAIDYAFAHAAAKPYPENFGKDLYLAVVQAVMAEFVVPIHDFFQDHARDLMAQVMDPRPMGSSAEGGSGAEAGDATEEAVRQMWVEELLMESKEAHDRRMALLQAREHHENANVLLQKMALSEYGTLSTAAL